MTTFSLSSSISAIICSKGEQVEEKTLLAFNDDGHLPLEVGVYLFVTYTHPCRRDKMNPPNTTPTPTTRNWSDVYLNTGSRQNPPILTPPTLLLTPQRTATTKVAVAAVIGAEFIEDVVGLEPLFQFAVAQF